MKSYFHCVKKKSKGKGKGGSEEWGKRKGKGVEKMCQEALLFIFTTFEKVVVEIITMRV